MVLIPPDAALRMRMQTEANLLQPVRPAHEVSTDLPDLHPGQTFSARIQETLPDNTYRALVAGKLLTLQLPEGAKAGDQLELVVLDRSGKTIIARQVESGATAAGELAGPYPFARFSAAARMIGQLLPGEGEMPAPAQLNRGGPVLAQLPPAGQTRDIAAQLAPALGKAVAQSGLFYEAHQAQWVNGKLPLAALLQEPQGQRSQPVALQLAAAEIAARAIATPERPMTATQVLQALQTDTQTATSPATPMRPQPAGPTDIAASFQRAMDELSGQFAAASPKPGALPGTPLSGQPQALPDDLRPLVQQQLEAAATNRMLWHGEVWPHQTMDWEIEWNGGREADGKDEEARWQTSLALTTPRLGRVQAHLQLTTQGVNIRMTTPSDSSANDLRDAASVLAEALAAAGIPLLGFKVTYENEYPAGQG